MDLKSTLANMSQSLKKYWTYNYYSLIPRSPDNMTRIPTLDMYGLPNLIIAGSKVTHVA